MDGRPSFMITTAIPYANGAPHIGHAYERIATDAIARFHRLDGEDVFFVTGMDEHGLKVQQTAQREGVSPEEFVDRIASQFSSLGALLHAPTDDFVRTTQPRHKLASQALWERMEANGDVYLSNYAGWYSVRDEAYYDEAELTDGPDGKRAPTGTPVQWVEEASYFFRLSRYAERLLALYESRPDFITPAQYRNEIVAFVKRGLADLSISRTTFSWGVPVPGDPAHVMYVWVDALTNYITAAGFPNPEAPTAHYWRPDEPEHRVVHVIGKDITRFHAIYWPAFLMSAGVPLPSQVVVHGFLFNRGEKMSKSVGNVIDPTRLVEAYGADALRYFLLRETPFGQDGSYSHEAIVQRINADLANDLGNLAQRSLSMIAKNCGGMVPTPGVLEQTDESILAEADRIGPRAREAMESHALHAMLAEVWRVVADANRYFAAQEPWALRKTDPQRMNTVLWVTAEVLRRIAIFAQPAMPEKMSALLDLLGVGQAERQFRFAGRDHALAAGLPLPPPKALFPRYADAEDAQVPA